MGLDVAQEVAGPIERRPTCRTSVPRRGRKAGVGMTLLVPGEHAVPAEHSAALLAPVRPSGPVALTHTRHTSLSCGDAPCMTHTLKEEGGADDTVLCVEKVKVGLNHIQREMKGP